jgi:hypothetical protein
LSQDTAVEFLCNDRIVRELESNFVVELPFAGSARVESQWTDIQLGSIARAVPAGSKWGIHINRMDKCRGLLGKGIA